jgi:hypothetical protein
MDRAFGDGPVFLHGAAPVTAARVRTLSWASSGVDVDRISFIRREVADLIRREVADLP